jgi:hypothetical protein
VLYAGRLVIVGFPLFCLFGSFCEYYIMQHIFQPPLNVLIVTFWIYQGLVNNWTHWNGGEGSRYYGFNIASNFLSLATNVATVALFGYQLRYTISVYGFVCNTDDFRFCCLEGSKCYGGKLGKAGTTPIAEHPLLRGVWFYY